MTPPATHRWRSAALLCALVAIVSRGGAVSAQTTTGYDGYRLDHVDSSAVLVATTLAVPSGSADDPLGLEGLTHAVAEAHRIALERIPGVLSVDAGVLRSRVSWTVLSTPSAADAVLRSLTAVDVMLDGLPTAIEEARRRLAFTATTPAVDVDTEAAGLFGGFGSPWSRPIRGTSETVADVDAEAARERWSDLLGRRAALVRVGPPDAGLDPASMSTAPRPEVPRAQEAEPAAPALAWTTPDRLRVTRDVTNVWIVAAFPIPSDLDRTTRDHLLHRIEEILNPVPGAPGTIGAGAEVARVPTGDVLVVRVTALPFGAARWEDRISSLPTDITPPFDPEFFRWERRRFRAHLLLRDARAGERALRIAHDLLETGAVRVLEEDAWELAPDDLSNAAERLGPPRILVFGPDIGAGG